MHLGGFYFDDHELRNPVDKLLLRVEPEGGGDKPPDGGGGGDKQKEPAADDKKQVPSIAPEVLEAQKAENARIQKELTDERAKRQALEAADAERERKRLEDEGKFKELADNEKKARELAEQRTQQIELDRQNDKIESELRLELIRQGAKDDELVKLVDKGVVKFEGGRVIGVSDAIKAFKEAKPHLFGTPGSPLVPTPTLANRNNEPPPKSVVDLSPADYRERKRSFLRGLSRR